MEARTVNNPPSAASHDETVRCVLAIELSKKSWIVAVNTPLSDKVSRHTLEACDWKGLLELIARIRTRVMALNRPVEVVSCYEAGYDGFWLHRLLETHGVCNYVIDPASVQVDRRARRVKTDKVDVGRLLRSLLAYLRGEPKVWSVVRAPSIAEEDDRRLHRERDRLINERVQHVNRIKGLLFAQGICDYEPMHRHRRARLDDLTTSDGRRLPQHLKAQISRELDRLELLLEQLKAVEAERDALLAATESPAKLASAALLLDLKGIGPEFASVLWSEGLCRSFANRRQVAAYAGLAPTPWQSGAVDHEQGVSKAGNPRLRTTMIQLAWLWLRHQPGSTLSHWFHERVERRGGLRKTMIVALARKLLVALWRYVTAGVVIQGATMKA